VTVVAVRTHRVAQVAPVLHAIAIAAKRCAGVFVPAVRLDLLAACVAHAIGHDEQVAGVFVEQLVALE
jgi:hypothetical protein